MNRHITWWWQRASLVAFIIFIPFLMLAQMMMPALMSQQVAPTSGSETLTQWLTQNPTSSTRDNGNFLVGCQIIAVSSSPIKALSRWNLSGNNQTHRVGLFSYSGAAGVGSGTGTLIGFVSIDTTMGTAGTLQTVNLATPITLVPGNIYILVSEEFNGGDFWSDIQTYTTTSAATLSASCFSASSWNTSPTFTSDTLSGMYDTVSFSY